jgi:Na+-translocating ferredoxin:NAD+ oxidoreductase subunit B
VTQALAERILAVLPQTQCTRCGYPDCAAYAQAIATGEAAINQCPPGGLEGIQRLATITGRPVTALNPENGLEGPRAVAVIDENWCIGCTLCLPACPTDAILGTHKMMHTVIEADCTGCELCIPVCPVDCISMENVTGAATGWSAWSQPQAGRARDRYAFKSERINTDDGKRLEKQVDALADKLDDLPAHSRITDPVELDKKRAVVEAALARARLKAGPQRPQ